MVDNLLDGFKKKAMNDKELRLLKEEEDFEVISENEIKLEDGSRLFTNSNGDISGRLLGFKMDAVWRNNKYLFPNAGSCYLNVNRYAHKFKDIDKIGYKTELALSLHDTKNKTSYYVKIPIGEVILLISCRNLLPNVIQSGDIYRRTLWELRNGTDKDKKKGGGLLMTSYFKALLNGDNIVELLVEKRKEKIKNK